MPRVAHFDIPASERGAVAPARRMSRSAGGAVTDPFIQLLAEGVQPRPRRLPWHGGPTTLGAVRGVSAEEAAWRPPGGAHTIWELTLHVAYWKHAVTQRITGDRSIRFPRSPANWPRQPARPTDAGWDADRALLRDVHGRLLEAVRAVQPRQLGTRPAGAKKWTCGELITGIAQHDAYHVGQIQILKRIRRGRRAGGRP